MDQDASRFANPASFAVRILFGGRWSVDTLYAMRSGPIRFGQLTRMVPGASKKGLTKTLRDLEAAGIVTRRDLSHVVLHIEYELKQDVKDSILALLDQLAECGDAFVRGPTGLGPERLKDGPEAGADRWTRSDRVPLDTRSYLLDAVFRLFQVQQNAEALRLFHRMNLRSNKVLL